MKCCDLFLAERLQKKESYFGPVLFVVGRRMSRDARYDPMLSTAPTRHSESAEKREGGEKGFLNV